MSWGGLSSISWGGAELRTGRVRLSGHSRCGMGEFGVSWGSFWDLDLALV